MPEFSRDKLIGISFGGASNYYELAVPPGALQGSGAYTVGVLVTMKTSTTGGDQHLFGNLASNTGYAVEFDGTGAMQIKVGDGSSDITNTSPAATLDPGPNPNSFQRRTMLVVLKAHSGAGNDLLLFINGLLIKTVAITNGTSPVVGALRLGLTPGGSNSADECILHGMFFHPTAIGNDDQSEIYESTRAYGDIRTDYGGNTLDYVWSVKSNLALLETEGDGTLDAGTEWISVGGASPQTLTQVGSATVENTSAAWL